MSNTQPNSNGHQKSAIILPPKEKRAAIENLIVKSRASWSALLPAHIKPDAIMRAVLAAVSKTPALVQCDPGSIVLSMAQACSLGLIPNTPLALGYLVPFKNVCTFIPGYRGLIRLAMQGGEVQNVETDTIRKKDHYQVQRGTDPKIVHEYNLDEADRGETIAVYSVVQMKSGTRPSFEFMDMGEVDRIMNRSQAKDDGPWKTDKGEMSRKTVFRRHSKWLYLSEEKLGQALELQANAEAGTVDFSDVIETVGQAIPDEAGVASETASRTSDMKDRLKAEADKAEKP